MNNSIKPLVIAPLSYPHFCTDGEGKVISIGDAVRDWSEFGGTQDIVVAIVKDTRSGICSAMLKSGKLRHAVFLTKSI